MMFLIMMAFNHLFEDLKVDIGYAAGGVAIGEKIFVLDQDLGKCWIIGANDGSARVFGRKGEGPGEFIHPERVLLDGPILWIGGRTDRKLQAFSKEGVFQNKTIRYGHGSAFAKMGSRLLVAGIGPGDKMVHWYNLESLEIEGSIISASKQTVLHKALNGNFYAVFGGDCIFFGDAMDLQVWRYDLKGKKRVVMRQSWEGINKVETKQPFGGKNPMDFITTLDIFRMGGGFLGGKDNEYLVVTWQPSSWRTDFIVQVFDCRTGELLNRVDTDAIPVCAVQDELFLVDEFGSIIRQQILEP